MCLTPGLKGLQGYEMALSINPNQEWINFFKNNDTTPTTDPTTLNLSPTTSTTNKFGGETLSDLVKRLQTEDDLSTPFGTKNSHNSQIF